jgi:hypothetical protein
MAYVVFEYTEEFSETFQQFKQRSDNDKLIKESRKAMTQAIARYHKKNKTKRNKQRQYLTYLRKQNKNNKGRNNYE